MLEEGITCNMVSMTVNNKLLVCLRKNEKENEDSNNIKLIFNPKYDRSGYFLIKIFKAPFRGGLYPIFLANE